jgi:arsenite-transporting ATPase
MRLRNPEYTRILIVTLPETTPVLEAAQLQQDLRRAEIEPHAWIINQSLAASRVSDPLLRQRALNERELISDVVNKHARQVALVPLLTTPPVGIKGLQQLFAVEGSSSSAD